MAFLLLLTNQLLFEIGQTNFQYSKFSKFQNTISENNIKTSFQNLLSELNINIKFLIMFGKVSANG